MKNSLRTSCAVLLASCALAPSARAQLAEKKVLNLAGAKAVLAAAAAEARRLKAGSAIAVVDDGGLLIALERLDDTFSAGSDISIGKARTAARFKKATKAFEDIIAKGRTSMVALPDFTPLQGGVPILFEGHVVGAIGVSGAHSAQEDEDIALAGARAVNAASCVAQPAAVTHLDRKTVDGAFEKGLPVFDGPDYAIHASRREEPGQAEVHLNETDIIHVLQGSATLVTGGKVLEGKEVAPREIRGSSIQDGQARRLSPGDVMVVPQGVPHWFKEVQGPVLYYVVKVKSDPR
jgi:glc operon protein GlcG